jgi:hypothetical protein
MIYGADMICAKLMVLHLITGIAMSQNCIDVLDLADVKVISPNTFPKYGIRGGIAGGSDGKIQRRTALRITLALDKYVYSGDETFAYEITATNISGKRLAIPWCTDGDSVTKGFNEPPPGFVDSYIYLQLLGKDNLEPYLLEISLYGSEKSAASLRFLEPDQCATIKGLGCWSKDKIGNVGTIKDGKRILEVSAKWTFFFGLDYFSYETRSSSNPVRIEIIDSEK